VVGDSARRASASPAERHREKVSEFEELHGDAADEGDVGAPDHHVVR
jgi:hypothetical protein